LTLDSKLVSEDLTKEIVDFCRHIAGTNETFAICVNGGYSLGLSATKSAIQVLAIIRPFQPRLMNYIKVFNGNNIVVFAVDKWVFERDVDRGFLGEALAGGLIFSYRPLINEDYLHYQELQLKKRLARELLESLVMDFPELSHEFYIKPEYFAHEIMVTRAKLFPPLMYALRSIAGKDAAKKDVEAATKVFLEALNELQKDGAISFSKSYVRMSRDFVINVRSQKTRITSLLKAGQRTLFTSIIDIFPRIMNILSQNNDLFLAIQKVAKSVKEPQPIVHPENYVYVPTATGLARLANRMDVESFAKKVLCADEDADVKVKNLGGILNDVYLVKTVSDGKERKVVVKRFRDWSSFKWFPLTLWSLGTRSFAVLGSSRLEKECAINRLLDSEGFAVPKILHVSPSRRLIFMQYVEGEDLSKLMRRAASSKNITEVRRCLDAVERVGELFCKVHSLGVALGDAKPENILIGSSGDIYIMDFEQASRGGDKVWDIAEFLYYAGHDIPSFVETAMAEQIAKAFVVGYLKAGGNLQLVRRSGSPKYTKVFSVFTFPHLIYAISNVCRKAEKNETINAQSETI
jgi:tRNA A-37 threonylcarbamoyl transferase component Bud32